MYEAKLLIDGKLVDGSGGRFDNINPATEEVIGHGAGRDVRPIRRSRDRVRRAAAFDDGRSGRATMPCDPALPAAAE